jgi:hypothetical protein
MLGEGPVAHGFVCQYCKRLGGSRTVQRISVEPHPAALVVVVISKGFPSHLRSALVRNWHQTDIELAAFDVGLPE